MPTVEIHLCHHILGARYLDTLPQYPQLPFQAGDGGALKDRQAHGKLVAQAHKLVAFPLQRRYAIEGGSVFGPQRRQNGPVDAFVANSGECFALRYRRSYPRWRLSNLAVDRRVYGCKARIDGPIQAGKARHPGQQNSGSKYQEQNTDRNARNTIIQDHLDRPYLLPGSVDADNVPSY